MGAMSPTHWLIVIGVLVLLFGAKKLPELARSVGQSTRVLRGEMRGMKDDEKKSDDTAAPAAVEAPSTVETPATARRDTAA